MKQQMKNGLTQDFIEQHLSYILKLTRSEPGASLRVVAKVIKQELQPEEVEALKKEL